MGFVVPRFQAALFLPVTPVGEALARVASDAADFPRAPVSPVLALPHKLPMALSADLAAVAARPPTPHFRI